MNYLKNSPYQAFVFLGIQILHGKDKRQIERLPKKTSITVV